MTPTPVKVIDFLPDKYRQATKRRRVSYWRAVVAVMFCGVFAACAVSLARVESKVRQEHEQVARRFAAATAFETALKDKESQLAQLREYADLITFLRHPWPRSRILDELFRSVPGGVTIEKLRMASEQRPTMPGASEAPTTEESSDASSAAADLALLRRRVESTELVVRLEGTTADAPALYVYLQSLGGNGLFRSADVEQVEAVREAGVAVSRFTARVVVRQAWGLADGPTLDELVELDASATTAPGVVLAAPESPREVQP